MWPALIVGAATSLAGGAMAAKGVADTNAANAEMAREQMAFQERMSNTSYQRAMEDMRAAGINPMLAAKLGGASTPGGAAATMENTMAPLAQGVSSAGQAAQAAQQFRLEKDRAAAQIALLDAQRQETMARANYLNQTATERAEAVRLGNVLTGARTAAEQARTGLMGIQGRKDNVIASWWEENGREFLSADLETRKQMLKNLPAFQQAQLLNLAAQTANLGASAQEARTRSAVNLMTLPEILQRTKVQGATAENIRIRTLRERLGIPRDLNEARVESSVVGEMWPWMTRAKDLITGWR